METLAGAWALILWAVLVMIVSVVRRRRCLRDAARPIRRGWQAALVAGALVIAAVAPAVGAWHGRFAFGLLLAGPIFCLVMAAGSLATELLVRPVAAPRRRATLAARHFPQYVDRPQLIAVCALFAVAVGRQGPARPVAVPAQLQPRSPVRRLDHPVAGRLLRPAAAGRARPHPAHDL